jgi:hypothetical protein
VILTLFQLSSSPEIFEKAVELFKKKWNTEQAFLNYFEREWLSDNSNWYEGVGVCNVPSTNNALEAFNKVIKRHSYPSGTPFIKPFSIGCS